jgi:hypothetical protein
MESEKLKNYLQSYFDSVIKPRVDRTRNELGFDPVNFTVHDVVKGSYQPPIYHIFLDTEPELKKSRSLKPHASIMMKRVEKDIEDFFKMFSIISPTKVHWNKRPLLKNDSIHTED